MSRTVYIKSVCISWGLYVVRGHQHLPKLRGSAPRCFASNAILRSQGWAKLGRRKSPSNIIQCLLCKSQLLLLHPHLEVRGSVNYGKLMQIAQMISYDLIVSHALILFWCPRVLVCFGQMCCQPASLPAQEQIVALCRALERQSRGRTVSNRGGWQSKDTQRAEQSWLSLLNILDGWGFYMVKSSSL